MAARASDRRALSQQLSEMEAASSSASPTTSFQSKIPERPTAPLGTASKAAAGHRPVQGRVAFTTLLHSWVSRKFAVGCAILFPVAVTVYVTWWFLQFFDSIFSPIYYSLLGFNVFGLGFITSMAFILSTGVFCSSWMGSALLGLGELIIHRLPLITHIYGASKQVSVALNPENESAKAFQECCLVRHPRQGEYAFGFITGKTVLQGQDLQTPDLHLYSVYIPTNHVYIGDILLMEDKDIIRTQLSVREGLELVVSVGMSLPASLAVSHTSQHQLPKEPASPSRGRGTRAL